MNLNCPHCQSHNKLSETRTSIIRFGQFTRKSDGTVIQRYLCKNCRSTFSQATLDPCVDQKKRFKNEMVRLLLCSGVSQRRCAMILQIDRKTVVRKMLFLAAQAQMRLAEMNQRYLPTLNMDFDDQETCLHTKCKPVAITLAVVPGQRRIMGFEVAEMPAKGRIARISREKYGRRPDNRPAARAKLFERLRHHIHPYAVIRSDKHPHYVRDIKRFFPCAQHETHKGRKSCIAGQGELKKIGFDPLFSINHTFAMMRANINRLFRKTWCISKKLENLSAHIYLYVDFHNHDLLKA